MTDHTPEHEALVIVDSDSSSNSPAVERTAVFLADPEAASLLLVDTVRRLIDNHRIQKGIVDLSTVPGLAVAGAFHDAGVPYLSLEYGQERHHDTHSEDRDLTAISSVTASRLPRGPEAYYALAEGRHEMSIGDIGGIDAEIVLVPKARGDFIDLSPETITGAVYTQCQELARDLLLVIPPERGVVSTPDGNYVRTIAHVKETAAPEQPAEHVE